MKKTIKVLMGTGVALVIAFLASALPAKADTNILVGDDLTLSSRGDKVVVLQGLLSELGFLSVPSNVPLGYFGALTKEALGKYQSSLNVYPPAGYFGPVTKVAMHQNFSSHGWLTMMGW